MLNLYRRHQPPCRYASRRYRNCNCPIWVQGSLRGEYIRHALDLRSWSADTDLVRDWEATSEIGFVKAWRRACWDDERLEAARLARFFEDAEDYALAELPGVVPILDVGFIGDHVDIRFRWVLRASTPRW